MFQQHDCTPSNTVPRNNLVPGLISTQLPAKLSKITPKFANYLFEGKSSTGSASRAKHFVASSRFNQPLENYRNWQVVCETLRLIEEASEREITRNYHCNAAWEKNWRTLLKLYIIFNNNFVKIGRPSTLSWKFRGNSSWSVKAINRDWRVIHCMYRGLIKICKERRDR